MRFDWNPPKAAENRRKHRVSFDEACTIFADKSILTIYDEVHSSGEDRWARMAMSALGRLLVVIHRWPEEMRDDELVRIISARLANKENSAFTWSEKYEIPLRF